ncbi:hypothetical protein [Caulobacter sp. 1776]|uniref:hypothetical protein n=1 Tax=Caulobacter sp. 1776 TaxID=3156420 RepID=UPI00339371A2
MATTQLTLKTYYDNLMRTDFAHIPAAHQVLIANLSNQVDSGTLTLAAAQSQVLKLAGETTSVASLAYSFFTGGIPYSSGFDYLVSPNGSNPNNLNSAYYQSVTLENRYINFAINLGKGGEGASWFAANYGALSMSDALIKAYTEIFGTAPDAAKVDAILNTQVPNGVGGTYTRQMYFASWGADGLTGQGTKAAMVGWLMAEAIKADTGVYAQANDAFLADLAQDGVAAFRSGLVTAYGTPTTGTTGATLTVSPDKSISPTATDVTLRSTANNDTITGTAGLNAGQSIDSGAGHDTINLTGTIYGAITTADGGDTITLGTLGASTPTLGVPAQYGTVTLAGGGTTVTLKGDMVQGTSLTATGTANTLHVDGGASASYAGTISGFQTVYYHTTRAAPVTGAGVLYSVVDNAADTGAITLGVTKETVVLKDSPNAAIINTAPLANGGTKVDIHLQNYKGAPTTAVSTGMGGYYSPNGGFIGLILSADSVEDRHATLALHVDTDSTAGLIYGRGINTIFGPTTRYGVENLTITGPGKLTAQISSNFTNVDATQAGDLNLTYEAMTSTTAQTFRLGDGTNTLSIFFNGNTAALTPASVKFYLGAGVDTIKLTGDAMPSPTGGNVFAATSLANLHIQNNLTVDTPPEIIGFQKGVDHLVLDALEHAVTANVQTYADGKTSLTDAVIAVSAHVAANTVAVFTWNGDTYVYAQDGTVGVNMGPSVNTGDGLIKLVGVTGLTVGTGAGSYDIHYG